MNEFLTIIWVLFAASFILPLVQRQLTFMRRQSVMRDLERRRKSRVITLIHRQQTMSILGIPIVRYIDIDDSERILRAIRLTPPDRPLDIVLHTPGGLVLAAEQIATALARHPGRVTVLIPHYAMSGGTMIALAADEIVMDPNAVLGPLDPQLGTGATASYPAASILKALEEPNANRADQTIIMGDIARKATDQVCDSVQRLLAKHQPVEQAQQTAHCLTDGHWTHDYAISVDHARDMGLSVSEDMPLEVYALMDLYEQPAQRQPSVEYLPAPYTPSPARSAPSKSK